jgi:hypothetical protein
MISIGDAAAAEGCDEFVGAEMSSGAGFHAEVIIGETLDA